LRCDLNRNKKITFPEEHINTVPMLHTRRSSQKLSAFDMKERRSLINVQEDIMYCYPF